MNVPVARSGLTDIVWPAMASDLGARLLGVYGTLEREGEVVHLIAKRLIDLSALLGRLAVASRDFH